MTLRRCPHCEAKNRVPPARLADSGRCGACGGELPPLDEPLNVGADAFREIVGAARVPVLVDFWAAWCGPCKMAAPAVERTAREMSGRAVVLKVDTEKHPALAGEFNVRSIPNFVVLKNGSIVSQHAGLVDQPRMRQWLEAAACRGTPTGVRILLAARSATPRGKEERQATRARATMHERSADR